MAQDTVHWPQVKALFTDEDIQHMADLGLDLTDRTTVCSSADEILNRVTSDGPGRMPPEPRTKWTPDQVNVLKAWKSQGCPS